MSNSNRIFSACKHDYSSPKFDFCFCFCISDSYSQIFIFFLTILFAISSHCGVFLTCAHTQVQVVALGAVPLVPPQHLIPCLFNLFQLYARFKPSPIQCLYHREPFVRSTLCLPPSLTNCLSSSVYISSLVRLLANQPSYTLSSALS
jgi:hypothetical protein